MRLKRFSLLLLFTCGGRFAAADALQRAELVVHYPNTNDTYLLEKQKDAYQFSLAMEGRMVQQRVLPDRLVREVTAEMQKLPATNNAAACNPGEIREATLTFQSGKRQIYKGCKEGDAPGVANFRKILSMLRP